MVNVLKETACIATALHNIASFYTIGDINQRVSRELLANLLEECVSMDNKLILLFENPEISIKKDNKGELCIHNAHYPDQDRNIIDYMVDMCILSQDEYGPEYLKLQPRIALFWGAYTGVAYYETLFFLDAVLYIKKDFEKKLKDLEEKKADKGTTPLKKYYRERIKLLKEVIEEVKNRKDLFKDKYLSEDKYPFKHHYLPDDQ